MYKILPYYPQKRIHTFQTVRNIIADVSGTMQFVYDLRVKGCNFISDDELDAGTVILHFGAY
jgi:hypothetical protein